MARGRKSLFREEYIQLAENYALLGATDDELADFFGVSKQTLNKWKKDYPEFTGHRTKRIKRYIE